MSNLRDHLNRFHSGLVDPMPKIIDATYSNESSLPASSNSSTRSSMHSISSYFKRAITYEGNSKRKREIDRALAIMIAKDFQPFNIVENDGFSSLKTYVRDGKRRVLLSHAIAGHQAPMIFNRYLTVTCNIVDSFELRTASLATQKLKDAKNHSAQNIADTLKSVLEDFNVLEKTVCIVTDNASSMLKACEILQIRNLPCFAHNLNLVVQDGLKIENDNMCLKKLFSKCKTTVKFFKQSTIANEKFKQAQESETPLSLLQEMPTRWNSFYFMIERIIKTNEAISKVLLATANAPLPFTANEINILKDICNILILFQNAAENISGGQYITVSLIIPIVYGLYLKIDQLKPSLNTPEGKMLLECLLESTEKRLFKYEESSIARIGTILDPRFKKIGFRNEYNAEQASVLLENELVIASQQKSKPNVELEASTSKSDSWIFDFLETKKKEKKTTSLSDAIIVKRQYLERGIASQDTDPMLWIQVNETEMDLIKTLMFKYLCVPCTSVESERMFSKAEQIVSERRTRLKEKNINMLMFLNKNSWLY